MRVAGTVVGLTVIVACTPEAARLPVSTPAEVAPDTPAASPDRSGPAAGRVLRIARDIESTYPLVQVWRAEARERARLIIYAVRFRLDDRSEHPDFEDWNAHVRRAAQDQREAAVAMLKRTAEKIPRVRLVSVYQDEFLQPFWSRPQIRAMTDPMAYREFDAWQDLVLSAAVLPGRPGS